MADFQTEHNRQNTLSYKWDNLEAVYQTTDVLPMWVADMDFKAPEIVNKALKERADHGIYGYTVIDESIRKLVKDWVTRRHNWNIDVDSLSFSPGVITSLHVAIQSFTEENDKILIQTPVYTPFFNIIKNGGREVVENELIYKDGKYEIDFADLEEKFKQGVKAFLFCSPHNPVGRVWTRAELEEIARLCLAYDVLVLSDEIHADLVFKGQKHIPFASLSEEIADATITFMSPTKTFNLAGLMASYFVTSNKRKRLKMNQALNQMGLGMLNTMGVVALEAAYKGGEAWLEELLDVLAENKAYVKETMERETDGLLHVIDSEGTYLLWIDCSKLGLTDKELHTFMVETAKVGLNTGSSYGTNGEQFMRMNIACPKSILEEGVGRIIDAVKTLKL